MRFDYVERRISSGFRSYGQTVARRPVAFIVLPLLFTLLMSVGFLHMHVTTDAIYLFTPRDAPSKTERMAIHEKWPTDDGSYVPGRAVTQAREIQITALARGNGNILEQPYSEAVYRLDSYIQNRVKVFHDGHLYSYMHLCLHFAGSPCPGNRHVHLISDLFTHGINITFPTMRMGSESGYLGSSLGGVSLISSNGSNIVSHARAWFLIYHLKFFPANTSFVSGLWENELGRAMKEYPTDPYITITYFHSQTLADELKRNADSLVPRFVIAFSLLVFFSAICSMSFVDGFRVDWVLSKPILAVFGVINAGLGIIASVGCLLLIGMAYNDIVAVMPFLVVAVGTDNMFLMVAAMRRTPRSASVESRMGECMADAAVSILITALTDAFSFGVGTITSIPAVQIFCVYTALALSFTFIFQITFFAALLALYTKWEGEGRNSVIPIKVKGMNEKGGFVERMFNSGSSSSQKDVVPWSVRFFRDWYAPVLMHSVVRALVCVWFFVYLAFAFIGCSQLKEGLEPINLLVNDSYAIPHYKILQDYFWQYGATLQVVVNNAPDLRVAKERDRVMDMAKEFCRTNHSVGEDSLQFWMVEMEHYYSELGMNVVGGSFYGLLDHFISARPNPWSVDVQWTRNETRTVSAFRLLVGMRDISSTTSQEEATHEFRAVAARFPEYNVTTFMPLWLFTDQYAIVVPNTIQNIVIALLCMIVIALVLIPQPMCAIWVAVTCASIDFGVIGFMTLWGVKLDAISMITIIMSIGFSVDYSAHITYGYVVSPQTDPKGRIQDALASLGWPLTQGALSTILAVSVLSDVPAYMIITFFKTVFLAISIGLIHGIVFLPVMLSLFVRGFCTVRHTVSPSNKAKMTPSAWVPSPIGAATHSLSLSSPDDSPDKSK